MSKAILLGVILGAMIGAILGLFTGITMGSLNVTDFYRGAISGVVVSEILVFVLMKFFTGRDWTELLIAIFFQERGKFVNMSLFMLIPAISVGIIATKITPTVKSWFA